MDLSDIKRLRMKVGLSQTALAKKAGVSQAHIAKIESGKVDPRFSTVDRIFRCLKEEESDHCRKYMTPYIYGVQHDDSVAKAGRIMSESVSQLVVFAAAGHRHDHRGGSAAVLRDRSSNVVAMSDTSLVFGDDVGRYRRGPAVEFRHSDGAG